MALINPGGERAPIPIADLTGYPSDATKYLRGDASWAVVSGGLSLLYDSGAIAGTQQLIDTGAAGVAQTATHLLILAQLRTNLAAKSSTNVLIQLNNDGTSVYDWQRFVLTNASPSGVVGVADPGIRSLVVTASTATAARFGYVSAWVPFYTAGQHKVVEGHFSSFPDDTAANFASGSFFGVWPNTAAITRLAFNASAGELFAIGSRVMVYGV